MIKNEFKGLEIKTEPLMVIINGELLSLNDILSMDIHLEPGIVSLDINEKRLYTIR